VSADFDLNPAPGPCDNLQYGQAEDYAIYIKPNTNPPVANFTANDTLTCSGVVQFTDLSLNVPTSWLWNFGDGNTSTSPNPSHTYTANGTYSVSLTVSNANGSNTLVKNNFITVTLGNTPVSPSCQPATFSYCCGYGIYKVQLNTINRSSQDASEGYQDFSCTDQTILNEGQSYTINIQTSAANPQDTKVWIDFNNDGTFNQPNELVFTALNTINPIGTITIPTGVVDTLVRMRISSDNAGANQGPCTALIRGQAEDYGVKIDGPISVEEVEVEVEVEVDPNPFSESATLRITPSTRGRITNNFELKIFDLVGKEMKTDIIRNSEGFVIRKSNLSSGIYIYKIFGKEGVMGTGKLVVE
jgi:PKD repeat protein